jgi:PPP family 3-phenylpropionic acid transporter
MPLGPARDLSLRLALFFVATFAVVGLHLPFFPVFLATRGFDPETIGIVLAVPLLVRIVAAPAISFAADRLGAHRMILVLLCILATIAFALFGLTSGLLPILGIAVLFAMVWTSVIPMTESLATSAVRTHNIDYGKLRSWGSLAFIVASFAGGALVDWFGSAAAYWMILAAIALTVPAALILPGPPPGERRAMPLSLADAARLVRSPVYLVLLLAVLLIQGAHALLYSFGTLHWHSIGISPSMIGILWAIGTGAEILTFSFAAWALRRFGPLNLVLIGGLAGVIRWGVTALDPPYAALIVAQALHALSFGASHLGALYLICGAVPQRLNATAQGVYSAVYGGIGIGGVIMLSGPLYAALGRDAFLVMAGLSLAGVLAGLVLARIWDGKSFIAETGLNPTDRGPAE